MPTRLLPRTWGLIRFWGLLAFRTRRASWAVRRSSSMVEAWEKKAVWGVMMMLGAVSAGWSFGGGAGSTTSRPAPARWPEWRASARACSWMIPPRAQLTIIDPGIIMASSSAPIMPSVSGVRGVWTVMKWERFRTSSKLMISTPSMVWPGSIRGS